MQLKCYEDVATKIDNDNVVCPKPINCTELVSSFGYESTVQEKWPSIVAILSCTLSVLGSLVIIYTYARWKDLRTGSRSIITFLAIADLVTASGYLMGSVNYIYHYGNEENNPECLRFNTACQIQSFITTTSSMCSFAWTSFLAVYLYLVIVKSKITLANKLMPLFHVIAWAFPLLITLPLLITGRLGYSPYAASNWCFIKDYLPRNDHQYLCGHLNSEAMLLVLIGGKAWEILTYVLIIVLYTAMKWHIYKTRESWSYQFISESTIATMQRADKKLTFIPVVFILLRMWGTIQFIYASGVAHLMYFGCVPDSYATAFKVLAYVQSIGDGGQGWGNILLYVISSPRIRQRLWNCVRRPNCRDILGLNISSAAGQAESQMSRNVEKNGSERENEQQQVSINDSTSFTPAD